MAKSLSLGIETNSHEPYAAMALGAHAVFQDERHTQRMVEATWDHQLSPAALAANTFHAIADMLARTGATLKGIKAAQSSQPRPDHSYSTLVASRGYLQGVDRSIFERFEAANPPEVFSSWKQDDDWQEWMRKSALLGGPTDRQLLNILQWNMAKMEADTENAMPEINASNREYLQNIERAVAEARLSPTLGERAVQKLPQTTYAINDPLYLHRFKGEAFSRYNVIRLPADYSDFAMSHERMHLLGQITKCYSYINEATTNILAREVSPTSEKNIYSFWERIVTNACAKASIGTLELSEHYANTGSYAGFRARVYIESGEDLLGNVTRRLRAKEKIYHKRTGSRYKRFYDTAISSFIAPDIVQEMEPHLTIEEVVRRDLWPEPGYDFDEQVENVIKGVQGARRLESS